MKTDSPWSPAAGCLVWCLGGWSPAGGWNRWPALSLLCRTEWLLLSECLSSSAESSCHLQHSSRNSQIYSQEKWIKTDDSVVEVRGQTSRQELHDEVEVHLILEAVEHLDNPQTVCLYQNIALSTNMTNLTDRDNHKHRRVQKRHSQTTAVVFQFEPVAASPVLSPACQLYGGSSWHIRDRCLSSEPDGPRGRHSKAQTKPTDASSVENHLWSLNQSCCILHPSLCRLMFLSFYWHVWFQWMIASV